MQIINESISRLIANLIAILAFELILIQFCFIVEFV